MFCEAGGCGSQPQAAPASRAQRRPVRCAHALAPRPVSAHGAQPSALSRAPLPSPSWHRRSFPPWAVPCSGGWQPWDTEIQPDVVGVQASLVLGRRAPRAHARRAVGPICWLFPSPPSHAPARPHLAAVPPELTVVLWSRPGRVTVPVLQSGSQRPGQFVEQISNYGEMMSILRRALSCLLPDLPLLTHGSGQSVGRIQRTAGGTPWLTRVPSSFRFPGSPILFLSQGPFQDPTCHAAAMSPSTPLGRDSF